MGQRLNIEIVDHERTYANAYYHWGAYSSTALVKTKDILDWYKENVKRYSGSPLLLAIKMLESTGAGVNEVEEYQILNDPNLELRKFMPQIGSGENHNEIPFDKIDEALDIHSKTGNGRPWGFKRADGSVVGWIE